jgi:hypothetical protein
LYRQSERVVICVAKVVVPIDGVIAWVYGSQEDIAESLSTVGRIGVRRVKGGACSDRDGIDVVAKLLVVASVAGPTEIHQDAVPELSLQVQASVLRAIPRHLSLRLHGLKAAESWRGPLSKAHLSTTTCRSRPAPRLTRNSWR